MNKLSEKEQSELCDLMDKKTKQLSAIIVGLIAIGVHASTHNNDYCFPSDKQAIEILVTLGTLADEIQSDIGELNTKLAETLN